MRWRKLGWVYCPDGSQWWARGYAHLPTAHLLDDRRIRVYFAGLDEHKFGRIGWVDVDADNPVRVLETSPEPVLDLGELGTFDDCGVVPSCVLDMGQQKYLYYVGFQRAQRVPYMLFSGLAISDDGGRSFTRHARVPLLDRTPAEPFSRGAPVVQAEDDLYRMWYWSCLYWAGSADAVHYNNVLRCASSPDGLAWSVHDQICVEPDFSVEYSIGRPAVVRDADTYRMWYSIRSLDKPYRIGYAESGDGLHWQRLDEQAGIAASDTGWDSEMICYPNIVTVKGARLMFYNGNRHGQSGFGCAVLEA